MRVKTLTALSLVASTLLFYLSARANSNPTSVIQEACEHVNAITSIEMPFDHAFCKMTRASYEAEWTNFDVECTSKQSKMTLKNCNVKYEVDKPKIKTIYQTCPTPKQLELKCDTSDKCFYTFPTLDLKGAGLDTNNPKPEKLDFISAIFISSSDYKGNPQPMGALRTCTYVYANKEIHLNSEWFRGWSPGKPPRLATIPTDTERFWTSSPFKGGKKWECIDTVNNCKIELLKIS